MKEEYNDAKKASNMVKVCKFWAERKTLEAAELGHPEAMGREAERCLNNRWNPNHEKGFEFATKAANENDVCRHYYVFEINLPRSKL